MNRSTPVVERSPTPRDSRLSTPSILDAPTQDIYDPPGPLNIPLNFDFNPEQSSFRSQASSPLSSNFDTSPHFSEPISLVHASTASPPINSSSLAPSLPDYNLMAAPSMPARGESAAPRFDRTKPRELSRFFDELEYLFVRSAIVSETEMKKQVLRYVDFEIEQIWKTFPEYTNAAFTYQNFKDAILVHYPDATGDYVYSLRDMDTLVGERQRVGMNTTNELSEFHLSFSAITTWLIEKKQLGDLEQQRSYLRAFQQPLLTTILNRLQLKFPDQHPNIPHKIKDVYEAARFVLQSSSIAGQNYFAPVPAIAQRQSPQPFSPRDIPIKTETFGTFMTEFTKTIVDALNQGNRSRIIAAGTSTSRHTDCNFCNGPHFIRDCKVVDEYITAGKCKRNHEGKVVLSTGAFVPRDIPGTLLRERVDEWHRRNPNQLSVASLIHTISREQVRTEPEGETHPTFQLSASDRIIALEAELFNLRTRRTAYAPIIKTRAQRARELPSEAIIEEVDEPVTDKEPMPEEVVRVPQLVPAKEPEIVITPKQAATPEHPYQRAKDGAYAPPSVRNVAAPVKVPTAKNISSAYKSLPPVHEPSIAVNVYKRAMDAPITITQRELLSLSPEVRAQVREVTTTKRVPTVVPAVAQGSLQVVDEEYDIAYDMVPSFTLGSTNDRIPPEGSLVVPDQYETYYNSLRPGEPPSVDRLTVAKESTAIRSIYALVDSSQKKECTVDPGCQVIAMSEATCHSLALPYDPRIRLNMESANGTYDWSLGLARNIPFLVGTVTLYLQVHVIRSPSYEILLGRPFDVLTESVVRNFTNEDQTITITDPNTGKRCTIPTFARGTYSNDASTLADF